MKPCLGLVAALAVLVLPSGVRAVGLSDLASPDDVMLRRPAQKDGASAQQAAREEAARKEAEAELKRLREQVN